MIMKVMKKTFALAAAVSFVCLSSVGAMAANKLIVRDAGGTTDKFVVTDSGTIGAGTNAPTAGIHVKGAAYPNNCIKAEGNETTQGAGFLGYIVRTAGWPIANDRLGFFLFGTTVSGTPYHAAGINAVSDGAWSATSTPAYFQFFTTPSGSAARAERMRLASSGEAIFYNRIVLSKNSGSTSKPACSSTTDGMISFTQGATGVKDSLEVCAKDAANAYAWRTLY
jgi:hypothetical protein